METVEAKCPTIVVCNYKNIGKAKIGHKATYAMNQDAKQRHPCWDIAKKSQKPCIDKKFIGMAANASGICDTARFRYTNRRGMGT